MKCYLQIWSLFSAFTGGIKTKKVYENWPRGENKGRSEVWNHFGFHAKDDKAQEIELDKSYAVCRYVRHCRPEPALGRPRITGRLCLCVVCLDWNRTLDLLVRF